MGEEGRWQQRGPWLSKYFKVFTDPLEDILTPSLKYTFHEKMVLKGDGDNVAQLVKSSTQADHVESG